MPLKSPHLEFVKLADLADGRLVAADQDALLEHASACPHCSQKLEHLNSAIEMMRSDSMEDAPPEVIERAGKLLRAHIKPPESILKQVLATLKFDSLLSAPAFGLRSGATSERQLLFSAGENDLHLQIMPAEEQWVVSGQVLGPCAGGEVELQGVAQTAKTVLSELCEFALDPVPEGTYALTLKFRDAELKVPELKLGL